MKYILSILCLVYSVSVFSQETDFQKDYLTAKTYFKEGQFGLAKSKFEELRISNPNNPFQLYADYYSALSYYHMGYNAPARNILLNLLQKAPSWEKNDEVRLWLSTLFFENQDPFHAIETGNDIKNKDIKESINLQQRLYLSKINSYDTLKSLYQLFPQNKIIAIELAEEEIKKPFVNRDYELLEEISSEHSEVKKFIKNKTLTSEKKDVYTVSCLLPFALERIQPDLSQKMNEFVLEFYRGLILAADSLNSTEKVINLQLFDTKRDSSTVLEILNDPDLAKSDLIIGPIYNSQLIHEYSIRNQINVINPFTRNSALMSDNPYYFLLSQLPEDAGIAAANYVRDRNLKTGKVFYSASERDILIKDHFVDSLASDSSIIIETFEINKENLNTIIKEITNNSVVNAINDSEKKADSIDFIFVAATNLNAIYNNVLTGVEAMNMSTEVIGSHNWLAENLVDEQKFVDLNITLAPYDLVDITGEPYLMFQNKYLEKFGSPPSKYAATGYELMMVFGGLMIEYGNHFQVETYRNNQPFPGVFTPGFLYYRSNSNQYVPIIKWDGFHIINYDKENKQWPNNDGLEEEK